MKAIQSALLGIALLGAVSVAQAQNEQFLPVLSYRVGPYAAGGSGYYGGAIDYWTLINMTGGVNGVKLAWEECETEYNASMGVECYERLKKKNGGATTVEPLSTGIAYGLFDRVAQDKIPMTTFGYGLASSADGRVYVTSRDGVTTVLKHGPTYEVLAENTLDDGFDASMALVDNEIFLRGFRYLYAIGQ